METLVRIAEGLGRFSARFVPSAFAIAVLLSLLTMGLALGWAGASLGFLLLAFCSTCRSSPWPSSSSAE